MLEDRIVYLNREFVAWDMATVHQLSHSFSRGSSIFEVISLYETDMGPAIFRLDRHLDRFYRSAELLGMGVPITREEFHRAVIETVKRNRVDQGIIKVIGYYPQVVLDVVPPQKDIDISIFAVDPLQDFDGLNISLSEGTTACLSKWRKLDPQTVPVEAKAAANYLNGMIARIDAAERGFEYAVMLDKNGFIAEGGTESIFLVKGNRLMTPSLGSVLRGISRMSILEAAEAIGLEIFEGQLHPEILREVDEAFLSSSPSKIQPIRQFEDRTLEPIPGPVSQQLMDLMEKILSARDSRFKEWLFMVE